MVNSNIKIIKEKNALSVVVAGAIDENILFSKVQILPGWEATVDTSGVTSINSFGAREWIIWLRTNFQGAHLKFVNCAPVFLEFVNMINGFIPANSKIESFNVPYFCLSCKQTTLVKYSVKKNLKIIEEISDSSPCGQCEKNAQIDVVSSYFFQFLKKND